MGVYKNNSFQKIHEEKKNIVSEHISNSCWADWETDGF